MLKKAYRLKSNTRIHQVRRSGSSWANRWVVLAKERGQAPQCRFAFVVSKRIGDAVQRNRIKRVLREAVRQRLPNIEPGWDIVVIARHPAREASFEQIDRAIVDVLKRAHLSPLETSITREDTSYIQ